MSRPAGEWAPPVNVMGGPPASELYRDLVVYAGLQLFQDSRRRPWVVLRDGAQRRAFRVPSVELRGALDRFRMRRNVRPVPESDIEEFARIVTARVSDPDVEIPVLRSPVWEGELRPVAGVPPASAASLDAGSGAPAEPTVGPSASDPPLPDPPTATPPKAPFRFVPSPWVVTDAPEPRPEATETTISGGYLVPPPRNGKAELERYVRLFRRLVRDGDWMGTTRELAELTRDDPFTLVLALQRYRADLAENDLLVANVQVGDGSRWLAVDRARVRNAVDARPLATRPLPAE